MRLARILLVAVLCLGIVGLRGEFTAAAGDEGKSVLKTELRTGTVIDWKQNIEETVTMTRIVGESTTKTEWKFAATHRMGMIFGDEIKGGWKITRADITTKRELKSYTVDGVDKKDEMEIEFTMPRLPEIDTVVADDRGRTLPSADDVPGFEAWENYVIEHARMLPEGEIYKESILLAGEEIGTVELKKSGGKSPKQWIVTGKLSAKRDGCSITVEDYSAKWNEGRTVPSFETFTAQIVRDIKADAGEKSTKITRRVERELLGETRLEGDEVKDAGLLPGLTDEAFEAIGKCNLTSGNLGKTPERVKVAAVEAFWDAVTAAPRRCVVRDALYAWFFNASVFIMPKIGAPAKPVAPDGWMNTKGIDCSDLEGKVIIIEFWSKNCRPCRKVAPHLNLLYKKYKDEGLEIIAITGSGKKMVRDFIKEKRLKYPIAISDTYGYIFDQNGRPWFDKGRPCEYRLTGISYGGTIPGVPHAFLVDRNGILRWIGHPGNIDVMLKKLMNEK